MFDITYLNKHILRMILFVIIQAFFLFLVLMRCGCISEANRIAISRGIERFLRTGMHTHSDTIPIQEDEMNTSVESTDAEVESSVSEGETSSSQEESITNSQETNSPPQQQPMEDVDAREEERAKYRAIMQGIFKEVQQQILDPDAMFESTKDKTD